MDVQHEDM
ncbi:unnamed protein product, partial [Adineta steineri]